MKLIIAYINPYKLDEIRDALKDAGVSVLDPDTHVSRGPDGLAVLDWPSVVSSVTR